MHVDNNKAHGGRYEIPSIDDESMDDHEPEIPYDETIDDRHEEIPYDTIIFHENIIKNMNSNDEKEELNNNDIISKFNDIKTSKSIFMCK